jgi:hypothetical protein
MSEDSLQAGDFLRVYGSVNRGRFPQPYGIVTEGGTITEGSGPVVKGPDGNGNIVDVEVTLENWHKSDESNHRLSTVGVYQREPPRDVRERFEEDYYATLGAVSSELDDAVLADLMEDEDARFTDSLREMYQCPACSNPVLNPGSSILLGRRIWGLASGFQMAKQVANAMLQNQFDRVLEILAENNPDDKITEIIEEAVSGTPLYVMEDPNHGSRLVHSNCESEPPGVVATKDDGMVEYELAKSFGGLK